MVNKYTIKEVNDFLELPDDRIEDCLKEFKTFIVLAKRQRTVTIELAKAIQIDADVSTDNTFVWIDDGENNITINFDGKTK